MRRMKKYLPHLVVFLSSMGVMIIELAASRIISKHFGNSLFTWTGVIGVVLAGISVGNWFGGRLADRYEPERTIGIQLFTASILVFGILLLDFLIGAFMGSHGARGSPSRSSSNPSWRSPSCFSFPPPLLAPSRR